MEKTPFAGLTVLEADESIYADNAAFVSRDRLEIDRALRIGVKLHRHDGSAGLSNPTIAPSGTVLGSGGTIPAGITLTLGYTLEDAYGGETQISPTDLVTTSAPLESPTTAPTAEIDYSEGTLDVDTYTYAVTWADEDGGETPIGPSISVNREAGFGNAQIKLGGLNTGMAEAGAAGWRLYRARAGGEFVLLAEGTGATYTDDGETSAQCDVHPPTFNVNTTGGTNRLKFCIPGSAIVGSAATWINLYASQSGDFAEACLLMQVPIGSAGACPIFNSLELLDWQPPDVNRSYGGANKIDPDFELIDWHWKRPVATKSELPEEAEHGDVRMVLDEDLAYEFDGSAWEPLRTVAIGPSVKAQGSAAASAQVNDVTLLEFVGSAGVNIKETEPSAHTAKVVVEGQSVVLANEGMGVLVCTVAQKGRARPTAFKQYTWFCKEKPTNMAEYDIWIEAGP